VPYSEADFHRNFSHLPGVADKMLQARREMRLFTYAQRDGYLDNLLPAPGVQYEPEYVDKALDRLDRQYTTEMRTRGHGRSHPNFNAMPDMQRMLMVQRIRAALGKA
jgi:hypothetical protein